MIRRRRRRHGDACGSKARIRATGRDRCALASFSVPPAYAGQVLRVPVVSIRAKQTQFATTPHGARFRGHGSNLRNKANSAAAAGRASTWRKRVYGELNMQTTCAKQSQFLRGPLWARTEHAAARGDMRATTPRCPVPFRQQSQFPAPVGPVRRRSQLCKTNPNWPDLDRVRSPGGWKTRNKPNSRLRRVGRSSGSKGRGPNVRNEPNLARPHPATGCNGAKQTQFSAAGRPAESLGG
jgi:hypothetical protein